MNSDLNRCFGCGADNPVGLHLKKEYRGNRSHIEFTVQTEHAGHPGLMHGGITCVLFDEVMYHSIARKGIVAVIARMEVDFRRPALVGDLLVCEAEVVKLEGRKIAVEATIDSGRKQGPIAEAKGLFIEVDLDKIVGGKAQGTTQK